MAWFGIATAMVVAFTVTPLISALMWRLRILDSPDGVRKLHGRTVPLGGGLAVWVGFWAAVVAVLYLFTPDFLAEEKHRLFAVGLAAASTWIVFLGLIDDRHNLRGRQKLVGQAAAAFLMAVSGCVIHRVAFCGWTLELGVLAIPFTMFWMLGAINAINLIDGVDGLCSTVGVILSGSLAVMSVLTGHNFEAVLGFSLMGAILGFLPHNFPRAKIFLGDTGSMLIGLMLGTLAIRSSVKASATLAIAAPVAIFTVLIFDVGMAIIRRKLTGRSLYTTDRGHLHHRLAQSGFSPIAVVASVGVACLVCSLGALASVWFRQDWIAAVVSTMVVIAFAGAKLFGHAEFALLARKLRNFGRTLVHLPRRARVAPLPHATRIQGHRNWDSVWNDLVDFATRHDLHRVEFHLHSPRLHEGYHADWTRRSIENPDAISRTTIPLTHDSQIVGRIQIAGQSPVAVSGPVWIGQLMSELLQVERRVGEILVDVQRTTEEPEPSAIPLRGPHTEAWVQPAFTTGK